MLIFWRRKYSQGSTNSLQSTFFSMVGMSTIFLIVHDSSEANIKAIHNIFNTIDVLKFTMEKEKNNTINFLDLTISKDFTNKQLRFNIYRKPTTTDIVIPNRSYTNISHKHASFRFLLNRAISIPQNSEDFKTEIQKIITIAKNNGYSCKELQNIYNKIHTNNITKTIYPHAKQKRRRITSTYHHTLNKTIKSVLTKYDIEYVNGNGSKIGNMISNCKHKFQNMEKSGIYRIDCNDCDKFYIGQCGRKILKRFKEHTSKTGKSVMARHLSDNNHTCNEANIRLLHATNKSRKMSILEDMEIYKHSKQHPEKILNEITDISRDRLFLPFLQLPLLPPPPD